MILLNEHRASANRATGARPLRDRRTDPFSRPEHRLDDLTDRELEILGLIADGLSNEGIASALVISRRTVDAHARAIFLKLGLGSDPGHNPRVRAVLTYWQTRSLHTSGAA